MQSLHLKKLQPYLFFGLKWRFYVKSWLRLLQSIKRSMWANCYWIGVAISRAKQKLIGYIFINAQWRQCPLLRLSECH
ncbi:hypothetical protein CCR75_008070 [Bremia lactucae]|uniref:Uncharacterized protein n=1 Tax=Bremia lactucae TaxID=4779 RepID=A0A976IG13_BRELC|nr:hypothetical protein CCR75_008070 [Bremia lactucae]